MGGLKKKMPVTYYTFLVFTLALCGIPFFSGFLSKDAILGGTLAFAMSQQNPIHYLLPLFGFTAAMITAFYMFRLLILTFHGLPRREEIYHHIHESPGVMTLPLIALALLSFFIFYTLPVINPITAEGGWFMHLIQNPVSAVSIQLGQPVLEISEPVAHLAHISGILISIFVALCGILLALALYYIKRWNVDRWSEKIHFLYNLSFHKYYFDEIYDATIIRATLLWNDALNWFDATIIDGIVNGSGWATKRFSSLSGKFDLGIIDGAVNGIAVITQYVGQQTRRVQTGQIQNYILGALLGIVVIILWTLF
jgi:NADH-quinone oxidoreductase subunit L